jgi:glycosyltransferase involved in cell wall biosynthesis
MRIFIYSTVFSPSVGGIETLGETLCRQFVALGHEVKVATETPGCVNMPFEILRQPNFQQFRELLCWCDVHMQANVSLKAAWALLIAPHKTLYQHNGVYQRDDGKMRVVDRVKKQIAKKVPGIANSTYTAARTGSEHVIFNAYDDAVFTPVKSWPEKDRDLVFLGRLVSQKGCDTLVDALGRLAIRGFRPALSIIGEGPDRAALELQAAHAGIKDQIRFLGVLRGESLAQELARHRIMVVPSRYEEPFGIVALEGLACGCLPVVSMRGGLVDAVGRHGVTFPNGDVRSLATRLEEILNDVPSARGRLVGVDDHLERFRAPAVAQQYIRVFERHLGKA